jgi:hypothetical protein
MKVKIRQENCLIKHGLLNLRPSGCISNAPGYNKPGPPCIGEVLVRHGKIGYSLTGIMLALIPQSK